MSHSTQASFMKDRKILYPRASGSLFLEGCSPLIALYGPLDNIAVKLTWHSLFVDKIRSAGYEGYFYIPCMLDADFEDYTKQQLLMESINNSKAHEQCTAWVYWQPHDAEHVDLKGYSNLLAKYYQQYYSKNHVTSSVFLGMENNSFFSRSLCGHNIHVYVTMDEIVTAMTGNIQHLLTCK